MAKNADLHAAKVGKNDEFYTQLPDIENELAHYRQHFRDKVVFCNCDDPYESNFFKYFALNFNALGLKKLIATCYNGSPVSGNELLLDFDNEVGDSKKKAYKVEINEVQDYNGDGAVDLKDVEWLLKNNKNTRALLKGNGDFRSAECVELLKEADIVVTNPPFSLFREYVAQLVKYEKKFLILGNMHAITYKDIFPLIKENKLWLGNAVNKTMRFALSPNYEKWEEIKDGVKYGKVPSITWYTNLDLKKRFEVLDLYKRYTPEEYPKYDNYDAIEVSKVAEIPYDYNGTMGVPVTFLGSYNPEQFEIIGCADADIVPRDWKGMSKDFIALYYNQGNTGQYKEGNRLAAFIDKNGNAKVPYKRILIRSKRKEYGIEEEVISMAAEPNITKTIGYEDRIKTHQCA